MGAEGPKKSSPSPTKAYQKKLKTVVVPSLPISAIRKAAVKHAGSEGPKKSSPRPGGVGKGGGKGVAANKPPKKRSK